MQVVGLVDSAKYLFVNEKARPYVYFPLAQEPSTMTLSVVRGRVDPSSLTRAVRAAIAAVDPYLGSMAVVVVLAFISAWIPANRAARVAPASALRSD